MSRVLTRAAELLQALAAALPDGVRGESRLRRRLWIGAALFLTLGPLAFNLARAAHFEASIVLVPTSVPPYPAVSDPGYYRSLLDDRTLREQTRLNVGRAVGSFDDIRIRPEPGTAQLVVTVRAKTPVDARRLAIAIAAQMAGATQRDLARLAAQDAAAARRRLATGLPSDERATLRQTLRRLEGLVPSPPARAIPGAPPPLPDRERLADRVVAALPGAFPGRPDPMLAAVAGLLVAVALWGACLVLAPPRRRMRGRDGATVPGQPT